ncbi:hypothetical protein JCM3774_004839 [Rhodotorula dairenensis]
MLQADSEKSTLVSASSAKLSSLLSSPSGSRSPSKELRQLLLLEPLPDSDAGAALRPRLWRLLLRLHELPEPAVDQGVHPLLDAQAYLDLASRAPSPMYSKIKNDTFRTLATDQEFLNTVGEDKLVRCLEAFVWRQLGLKNEVAPEQDTSVPYVQGQNVLAAPFLYGMPSQLEAFACFTAFIEEQVPRYVRPTLVGVHDGLQLVDSCLQIMDPELYQHLSSFNLKAEIYAFPSILTVCVATPPLSEVLALWDFLLAWGPGLNVLCVVAQLHGIRAELLQSKAPMKLLRTFPPLRSREIVPHVVQFVGVIPASLYDAIVRHPWDDSLVLPCR